MVQRVRGEMMVEILHLRVGIWFQWQVEDGGGERGRLDCSICKKF